MVTFRPMELADAPGAVAAFEGGLLTMLARHGLPVTGNSIQDERRRIDRTRHFLGTDPGGSWVAVDDRGTIIGVSQSFVREDYWMLSQLGAVPGVQGQGIGRELLRLALSHGDPQSPGTIQCSRDPKAMALYTGHGFHLHPVVAAWGIMRPGSVSRPDDVVRVEPDHVTDRELDIVTAIDRSVRGSARTVDVVAMLAHPGNRLLLHGDQAYAVVADDRIVTLGAHQEESAVLVLRAMLAEAPAGETIEINWLTSAQQWAIGEVVAAGIELQPFGPVMVRGMDGPPRPYIPSGGYG
jgi:GNAT superfamily N-acetyltransferase